MLFICQRNYTKGVTNSKKARQYNGQKKKNLKKKTNNDLQNITQKTKNWELRTTQRKQWGKLGYSGRVDSFRSTA